MKILQIINNLGTGGAEKILLNTVPKYVASGITMDVLVLDGKQYPFLMELQQYKDTTIYSCGEGSVYNPLLVFRIVKYLRRYDILHVHLFPAMYWVALAKFISFSRTELIFTEHNTTNRRRGNRFFKFLDKIMYGRYQKIVTISSEVDAAIKKHLNFDIDRFEYIRNGAPISEIRNTAKALKEDFAIPKEEKVIIQVSSFTKQKDQQTLIRSLLRIDERVTLLLVGEGPLLNVCMDLVAELKLEDRVQFLGIRMDVPALLKMADIVVLSTHFEGLSLSSIEALASGKPFVASEAPGLAPIVKDAGILFPIGDEINLATNINRLLQSNTLYSEIAEKCLERAQQYNIEKMIEKHLNLYQRILQI
jgi:glycosyltransferase involved in cell wall biosynthesis